ncbi:Tat (twin-arginine translocation) pathway signal sequence [Halopelagius inordinatus]|uniref:Tat (Twin-arginine translocation) pathway signal sequence n=1 Tax=Halopelagius inordinatus TaxID=553467 RepID=A0A1I2W3N2_9EURY|nr:twin-arginine translocation signal domain-containing protein [Halopelagius inordinatus]SFG95912.1 Tat (twin-arginine translocation) pathway signal sequence [Halopelagius inordinatus]
MASDDSTATQLPSDSESDVIGRIEDEILSRRGFLVGLATGGVGGAGAVLGLTHSGEGFQSLATLAGGATLPAMVQYYLPAVDSSGEGLILPVKFVFSKGDGELFVDVGDVEVRHDLQLALREATETATRLTGSSLAGTAIRVTFDPPDSDVLALGGKSWEAGLTVALIASLRRQSLPRTKLITGVVNDEGVLLPVGKIEAKARAARALGATELIVSDDTPSDVTVQGIRVVEVASIWDALDRIL